MHLTGSMKLEAVLAAAHTMTAPSFVVAHSDAETTSFGLGFIGPSTRGTLSNVDTTIAAAPSAGRCRRVHAIAILNRDTVSHTVSLKVDNSGAETIFRRVLLAPGESLTYGARGWRVEVAGGGKVLPMPGTVSGPGDLFRPALFTATSVAVSTVVTSTQTGLWYLGQARRAYSSVDVRLRKTATATITWAEAAIYRGHFHIPAGAAGDFIPADLLGYLNTAASWGAIGDYTHNIPVTGVRPGDHLWVGLGGTVSAGTLSFRGGNADNQYSGVMGAFVGRPSTAGSVMATVHNTALNGLWAVARGNV